MYNKIGIKIMQLRLLPFTKLRSFKPLLAQVTMRVNVKTEHEYHSYAYAIRVIDNKTELLMSDKDNEVIWMDISQLEAVEGLGRKGEAR
jgi:hypothetical protein